MWLHIVGGLTFLGFILVQYLTVWYGEESLDDYYWMKKEEKEKDKFEKNCA